MRTKRQIDATIEPILRSNAIRSADRVLRAVAGKDVILTLIGESGTGKEVLARRAHELSPRRRGPFVPVNCAAIPEALFESELFGHERGAFTGANQRARGKIEAAEKGTLFLDEIGETPIGAQAKLLRFLENRRYTRVGSATKVEADVRLVFATLRPLEQDVRDGRFRADLFYRIQGITLDVPPLRERKADILPLVGYFVAQLAHRHGVEPPKLGRRIKALLLGHDWPGNVRELRNVVEALCLLRPGRPVRTIDLPARIRAHAAEPSVDRARSTLAVRIDDGLPALIEQVVEAALALDHGDPRKAAARLGISTRTVQRYITLGRVRRLGAASSGR